MQEKNLGQCCTSTEPKALGCFLRSCSAWNWTKQMHCHCAAWLCQVFGIWQKQNGLEKGVEPQSVISQMKSEWPHKQHKSILTVWIMQNERSHLSKNSKRLKSKRQHQQTEGECTNPNWKTKPMDSPNPIADPCSSTSTIMFHFWSQLQEVLETNKQQKVAKLEETKPLPSFQNTLTVTCLLLSALAKKETRKGATLLAQHGPTQMDFHSMWTKHWALSWLAWHWIMTAPMPSVHSMAWDKPFPVMLLPSTSYECHLKWQSKLHQCIQVFSWNFHFAITHSCWKNEIDSQQPCETFDQTVFWQNKKPWRVTVVQC